MTNSGLVIKRCSIVFNKLKADCRPPIVFCRLLRLEPAPVDLVKMWKSTNKTKILSDLKEWFIGPKTKPTASLSGQIRL